MNAKANAPFTQLVRTWPARDMASETRLGFGPFVRALAAGVSKHHLFIAVRMTLGTSFEQVSTPICAVMQECR